MSDNPGVLDWISGLLRYPDGSYLSDVARAPERIARDCPKAAAPLEKFRRAVAGSSLEGLEELFIRTFDLSPVCAPEVGWHLYGDEYARGRFLVSLRQLLRRHGIPEVRELPDHLCHVLPLVERMPREESHTLVSRALLPALEKMIQALEDRNNPYLNLLLAIRELVRRLVAAEAQEACNV